MATNLAIDDRLIQEAVKIGGHKTKKLAVTTAVQEYIQHHKQLKIIDLFGTIDFGDFDHNSQRNKAQKTPST